MATLNELGRNSASVTYGPSASGSDLFPTLQAVDTWFRNDTFQGVTVSAGVTAANAVVGNSSATSGTIWNTQARAGDYIMIAGQQKIIANVSSDQNFTVTGSFSPAITLPSAVKAISTTQPVQTTGYLTTTVRGATTGTVYVTNGSTTVNGVGTYFLSDATNSVTLTATLTGTIAIDTAGNITGTSTLFSSQQGNVNGLYPGDSIAVSLTNGAVYYFTIATVTSDTAATVTVPPTIAISGASLAKATNGSSGRYININGRIRQITSINSNTSMTVNFAMDFTDSNLRYKVYPRGTISNTTSAGGTIYQTTSVTTVGGVANATVDIAGTITGTNPFVPGAVVYAAASVTAGTYILNQVWATGPTVNNTSVAGTNGTNILTTSGSQTGTITVGQLVTGSGAIVSGVAAGTYVVGITGTSPNFTITLSQNLTGTVSGTVYFATPGAAGRYTFNQATTASISAATLTVGSIQGTNTNFFWDLGYYNTNAATSTPYMYQTSLLDQVWVNDEVRTFNFNSFGGTITGIGNTLNAYVTDYVNSLGTLGTAVGVLRQPVYLASFKREDSYINGTLNRGTSTAVTAFTSDLRIGDDLIIDGTEVTVTQIVSDSQFKVNYDFTHTTAANSGAAATASPTYSSGGAPGATTFVVSSASNISVGQLITGVGLRPETYVTAVSSTTITVSNAFIIQASGTYNFYNGSVFYKKLKLHGYVLEGTREGGTSTTTGLFKWSQATTLAGGTGTNYPVGTTSITVTAASSVVGPYQFVKISGGGGPPLVLAGQATCATSTVTGVGTNFTSSLHVGAEIILAGQYLTVTAIASDTSLTVSQTATVSVASPIYRSVPLYTYTTAGTTTITLATPLKNNLFVQAANPPQIAYPSTGADFIEYVYSAPNYSAEQGSTTLLNTSNDRKYVAFRFWPLFQSTNVTPTGTATIGTAFGAYATPVYERWSASYAQTHGVGINQADLSGGTMIWGTGNGTTTMTLTQPVAGSLQVGMGIQGLSTGYPNVLTALASGTAGLAASTYTMGSSTITGPFPYVASLYGVSDITAMSQVSGGFLYLFANKRYLAIQGRTSSNIQTQLQGCLEFERAQPEDLGTGTGTASGITFGGTYGGSQLSQGTFPPVSTPGFGQNVIQSTPGVAPWPCYGYFNGNRLPTGAQQIPTLPQAGVANYPVHGCVISVPRVRNSVSDLVGFNAHIYSALTITTGRWGHVVEFGSHGVYSNASVGGSITTTSNLFTSVINALPQIHMGQIVPVYTNIYNAKRFMFSPVVVLGPAYDPDVRGRLFGLKVLPSGLGTLMDTVSITVDSNFFYNTASAAADHWVTTTPPAITLTTTNPGQIPVQTTRFTLTTNTGQITQSWRSLEDNTIQASSTNGLFVNNFRYAFPA
jgi:hypothetical protein